MTIKSSYEDAIKQIGYGNSIIFLGSGFSNNVKRPDGSKLPLAVQLSKILSETLGEPNEIDLDVISDIYVEDNKQHLLYDTLVSALEIGSIPEFVSGIVNFPWKSIYTTNYDEVIEDCTNEPKEYQILTKELNNIHELDADLTPIIHLNGRLRGLNKENFLNDIKITNTQYLTNDIANSSWSVKFRSDISTSRSVFFVGYSMADFDISRLLFESTIGSSNIFFIQHNKLSDREALRLGRFGNVQNIGVEQFANDLNLLVDFSPPKAGVESLTNFRIAAPCEVELHPSAGKDVFDLIVNGNINQDFLAANFSENTYSYGVKREEITAMLDALEKGEKNFLIRGDIGNGKNFLAQDFLTRLSLSGLEVVLYEPRSSEITIDVESLSEIGNKSAFFFSDAYACSSIIKIIRTEFPDSIVVACSRSAIHELQRFHVEAPFLTPPYESDVDRLSDEEIDAFVTYLQESGLWGKMQGEPQSAKINFVKVQCKRSLRGIILKVFEEPSVKKKLEKFVDSHRSSPALSEGFFRLSLVSATGFDLNLGMVQELLGLELARQLRQRSQELILEFFHLDKGRQVSKSAIVSEFFVKEFMDDKEKLDMMADLAVHAWHLSYNNLMYRDVAKRIMVFSFVEKVLKSERSRKPSEDIERTENLVYFYELLRRNSFLNSNPQFWLQYAMATMSFQDYNLSEQYFQNAYGISDKWEDYNSKQIDTQYARFLIEKNLANEISDGSERDIENSMSLIEGLIGQNSNEHHPYKSAALLLTYFEQHMDNISHDHRMRIVSFAETMRDRLTSPTSNRNRHYHVRRCLQKMTDLLDLDRWNQSNNRR